MFSFFITSFQRKGGSNFFDYDELCFVVNVKLSQIIEASIAAN